ncbi:MAG: hypothetical protein WBG01_04755 [Bacteroidota bacterium]
MRTILAVTLALVVAGCATPKPPSAERTIEYYSVDFTPWLNKGFYISTYTTIEGKSAIDQLGMVQVVFKPEYKLVESVEGAGRRSLAGWTLTQIEAGSQKGGTKSQWWGYEKLNIPDVIEEMYKLVRSMGGNGLLEFKINSEDTQVGYLKSGKPLTIPVSTVSGIAIRMLE